MKRLFRLLSISLVCVLLLCGCATKPEVFEKDGMRITLTSAFSELEQEGLTVAYQSRGSVVLVFKEDFSTLESVGINADSTPEEYANAVFTAQQLQGIELQSEDGLLYFIYERSAGRTEYAYLATVHKSASAFWLIQFSCSADDFEEMRSEFVTFAQSITFTK